MNVETPFYGYLYELRQSVMGNLHELWVHGDLNYGTGIKQCIHQQGWETFYDPISLVPYMLKTDASPG